MKKGVVKTALYKVARYIENQQLKALEELMRKNILMVIMGLVLLVGCAKQQNITFEAQIDSVSDQSIMITTHDAVGFDKASVGISKAQVEAPLAEGQKVKITIHPEIRESYPIQVTATKVEVMKAAYQVLTAKEAKAVMDQDEYDTILDVRTLEEYNEGHIEGAILLPDYEIKEKAEELLPDKTKTILIYCRSGRRSKAAAKELIDMGYTSIYDFGGIIDWPYEVVKDLE